MSSLELSYLLHSEPKEPSSNGVLHKDKERGELHLRPQVQQKSSSNVSTTSSYEENRFDIRYDKYMFEEN